MFNHPFRALLAGLGVVFGVAAVIAMMAISEGARVESLRQIQVLGVDKIILRSVKPDTVAGASSGMDAYGLVETDLAHVRDHLDNVADIIPIRNLRKEVSHELGGAKIGLFATTPAFMELTRSQLWRGEGRFLLPADEDAANPVCVVGRDAARSLFAYEHAIGRDLLVNGVTYRVVGVLENSYSYTLEGGHDVNHQVFIPMATAQAYYGTISMGANRAMTKVEYDYLYVLVNDVEGILDTSRRLRNYFGKTHAEADVAIDVPYELLKQKEGTQRIFTIVMASIAAISLLVGGIGIMNIMMANVYERMREIGTRRALGARSRDILHQFLFESIFQTAVGGVIGVGVGYGLAKVVQAYAGMPTEITASSVLVSLVVSVLTGVLFGTFPAWKAANLDPIVALRHE
jgi:putative ABC transport system permease protein